MARKTVREMGEDVGRIIKARGDVQVGEIIEVDDGMGEVKLFQVNQGLLEKVASGWPDDMNREE